MRTKWFAIVLVLLLGASACGPQAVPQAPFAVGSQAWIDAPLQGSQLLLAPVEILAHAASSAGIVSFQILLNGQPLATTLPFTNNIDPTLVYTRYNWQPSAPGLYRIEVTGMGENDQPGPSVQVTVEVVEEIPAPGLTLTPTAGPLTFTPGVNAYCRQGPDEVFPPLDEPAMMGQVYPIDGRNTAGTWYRIMLTPTLGCWVPAGVGTPSGDVDGLRVLLDIPTPTACFAFTDQGSCEAQSTCQWKPSIWGGGVCDYK